MDELELLRRSRPEVPPPGDHVRERARGAFAAGRPRQVRARGRATAGALAATTALAAAVFIVVIGGGPATMGTTLLGRPLGPAPAAAAVVEAVRGEGWVELRFIEPAADEQRILDEIRAAGLDVEVRFQPASPSLEWQVTGSADDGGIEYLAPETGGGGPVAVRVLSGYRGGAQLMIGRPARPGESYDATPAEGAQMPGEALHCSGISGLRVEEAQGVLDARGLTAEWRTVTDRLLASGAIENLDPVDIAGWYVQDATPWAAGEVLIWAAENPPPVLPAVEQARNADCTTGDGR